jgi:hypothetical protein
MFMSAQMNAGSSLSPVTMPAMSGVLSQVDARQLRPVIPELTAFVEKVRKTTIFLSEVG